MKSGTASRSIPDFASPRPGYRYFALICPGSFRMISGLPLCRRTGPVISTVLPLSASTLENLVTSREKMTAVKVLFGYSNTFRVRASPGDFGIAFGYQTELPSATPGGPDQIVIIDEVEIALTPIALKLLQIAVNDNLEAFEAATGKPVDLPQGVLEQMTGQKERLKAALVAQVPSPPKT